MTGARPGAMETPLDTRNWFCRENIVNFVQFLGFVIATFDDRSFLCLNIKSSVYSSSIGHAFDIVFFFVFGGWLYHAVGAVVLREVDTAERDIACQNIVNEICGRVKGCKLQATLPCGERRA